MNVDTRVRNKRIGTVAKLLLTVGAVVGFGVVVAPQADAAQPVWGTGNSPGVASSDALNQCSGDGYSNVNIIASGSFTVNGVTVFYAKGTCY
jgi:hypothetical protein